MSDCHERTHRQHPFAGKVVAERQASRDLVLLGFSIVFIFSKFCTAYGTLRRWILQQIPPRPKLIVIHTVVTSVTHSDEAKER